LLSVLAPHALAQELEFAPLRLGLPPSSGGDAALVDWDGDGDLDWLRGSSRSAVDGELSLLENDGHGRFRVRQTVDQPVSHYVVGDLNGDGAPDGLAYSTPNSLLALNDRGGGFTLSAVAMDQPYSLELVDLDGDGDLDVLMSSRTPNSTYDLRWLRNHGDATFDAPLSLGTAAAGARFGSGDLDGDGDVDLFVLVTSGFVLQLLYNDGAGGFADRVALPLHLAIQFPAEIAGGDVNGDGTLDILFTDPRSVPATRVRLLLGLGGRAYQDASAGIPAVTRVSALTLADADGDGALDLFTGANLLRNVGGARFQDVGGAYPSQFAALAIEVADLDGDGDADALLGDQNQLLLGDGTGAFLAAGAEPVFGAQPVLGDVDGDGDLDVIANEVSSSPSTLELFRNDGRGVLHGEVDSMPPELDVGALRLAPRPHLADLDSDGDLDFYAPGIGRVGLNDGVGAFASLPCLAPFIDTRAAALGDLDGDGDVDAYLATAGLVSCHFGYCYQPERDRLALNDGTGCLLDASTQLPPLSDADLAVALGDLDLDGDLDVVTSTPRALQNDGTGFFSEVNPFVGLTTSPRAVALGDFDGNGALDVYLAGTPYFTGEPDTLLENDGSGHLSVRILLPTSSADVALGDLDGDGDLDVVARTQRDGFPGASALTLLRNDGASFAVLPQTAFSLTGAPVLGDLDRDGDLDLLDGRRVLFNLRRSLSNRGVPRLGQPFALELAGSAHAPYALIASTALAPRSSALLGLRQLDFTQRVYQRQGALDAAGRSERGFFVPRTPALLGATLYWQALVGTPLRWSNRETTTLVGY